MNNFVYLLFVNVSVMPLTYYLIYFSSIATLCKNVSNYYLYLTASRPLPATAYQKNYDVPALFCTDVMRKNESPPPKKKKKQQLWEDYPFNHLL